MPQSPPTNPLGYTDDSLSLDGYGSLVDAILEHVPDLVHPASVRTYARMRHDPQLAAILKAYLLAAMRANWAVNPAGCRDEVAQQTADDLGLPILGVDPAPTGARRRAFTFAEHLRLSLLDQVFGHMFFEQSYAETGGRWRLAAVQERMPQTVAEVKLHRDGTIRSVVQDAFAGRRDAPEITADDHRLVYYVNEREGSNYFGRSALRPSYGPWLIKDQVLRVHATSIRRFGMGVPTAQALPGTNPTPQELAEAQRAVAMHRASEHSGVAMPAKFRLELAGLTGSVPDALGFVTYLDRQMTRSTLTSLLDMATAERGARSLGETVMDLMIYAQQAVADAHADVATRQLVVPLVDANWGEDEPAPQVVCSDVGADLELTAQDVMWLMQAGALTGDPNLWAFFRDRYGIPEIDPAYLHKPEDVKAMAQAVAASPVRPLGHLIPPTTGGDDA